jgi:drug/metabolite transporter (DMT)-like permease
MEYSLLFPSKNKRTRNLTSHFFLSIKNVLSEVISKASPTFIGYLALIIWSLSASAAVHIAMLPVFQILIVTFFLAFLLSAVRLTVTKAWSSLKQPWYIWVIGVLGICAQQFFYLKAFQNGPAAQVDIIVYLWPLFLILLIGFLPKEKIRMKHITAVGIGFIGILILNIGDQGIVLSADHIWGYAYALVCAVLWSGYTLSARYFKKIPTNIIGIYCGIGSVISLIAHLTYEKFVMPTLFQLAVLFFIGLFVSGAAYLMWDYGIKKGNIKLLAILSYMNPILSIGFLSLLSNVELNSKIAYACILIAAGGWMGGKNS